MGEKEQDSPRPITHMERVNVKEGDDVDMLASIIGKKVMCELGYLINQTKPNPVRVLSPSTSAREKNIKEQRTKASLAWLRKRSARRG